MHCTAARRIPLLLPLLGAALIAVPVQSQEAQLGHVDFPNSGAAQAQAPFLRGVLLLHSFEYEDAREAFQEAQALDPDFALAHWGEALTHSHPLWREEDVDAALAALAELAPTPEERAALAPTEREKRFLASVERLFGEGDRLERHQAYSDALGAMWRDDPTDLEAGALHALSILGTSLGVRDQRAYMRAAGVGEQVYLRSPKHPGVLHYLIHCYDDPVHAPLGLRMARVYDGVAPAAAHALHMPSHIYVALGLWADSVAANENSVAAADARRERKELDLDARGWHSMLWLHYSYLQQGRVADAERLLTELRRDAELAGTKRTRDSHARMRAAHLVDLKGWDSPAAQVEIDLSDAGTPTVAADHLVRGLAALGRGEATRAKEILATMRGEAVWDGILPAPGSTLATCCSPASAVDTLVSGPGRMAAEVMARELEGAILLAEGEVAAGLDTLRRAAQLEDEMGFDFGPPIVVYPAHELLGEALLEQGRAAEAALEFEAALARAPRRTASLRGLAAALEQAGESAKAQAARAELALTRKRASGAPAREPGSAGAPGAAVGDAQSGGSDRASHPAHSSVDARPHGR